MGIEKVQFRIAIGLAAALLCSTAGIAKDDNTNNVKATGAPALQENIIPATTKSYNETVLNRVDGLVRKKFFDRKTVENEWMPTVEKLRLQILASKNLAELSDNINLALKSLHSSHCQFVTKNDETFYFLHSLFHLMQPAHGKCASPIKMDFIGATIGGSGCRKDEVRYVLDGTPAAQAGMRPGDIVLLVDGHPYQGQLSFAGTAGHSIPIKIQRGGESLTVTLKPQRKEDYDAYLEAIAKSARILNAASGKKLAYVHLWSGGSEAHGVLMHLLATKLHDSDGLIFDLRDGYGASSLDDIDPFFRPEKPFYPITMIGRDGVRKTEYPTYNKPVVVLINGGTRSGKEMLAHSLKISGRAKLVGERTAGFFVAGQLQGIDDQCALYLAIIDMKLGGIRLEGAGVMPDVIVPMTAQERGVKDKQLEEAQKILESQLP